MKIEKGDLGILQSALHRETVSQEQFVETFEERLRKDGIYQSQQDYLQRMQSLEARLKGQAFCVALPFGINDKVYAVHFGENCEWQAVECTIYQIKIDERNGSLTVEFFVRSHCYDMETGTFLLRDVGKGVFLYRGDAQKRCDELNLLEV